MSWYAITKAIGGFVGLIAILGLLVAVLQLTQAIKVGSSGFHVVSC
jgi:hypothetical protein